jgi:hypothetical protein
MVMGGISGKGVMTVNRWIVVGRWAEDVAIGEIRWRTPDGRLAVRWDGLHPDDLEIVRLDTERDPALYERRGDAEADYDGRVRRNPVRYAHA